MSVFTRFESKAYPFRFAVTLEVAVICGGIPSDPHVAEGWLRSKLALSDELIRQAVAETMAERGVTAEEAAKLVDTNKHLNGFKRDDQGLYIEGRQLKAAIKEAGNVAINAGKLRPTDSAKGWGVGSKKGWMNWAPEHIFVVEDRIHLGATEPAGVNQRFVHTFRGSGIQYEEYVEDAKLDFTVITDYAFTQEQWAMIWLTGQQQGIGATRSQGYGRYEVVRWDPIA